MIVLLEAWAERRRAPLLTVSDVWKRSLERWARRTSGPSHWPAYSRFPAVAGLWHPAATAAISPRGYAPGPPRFASYIDLLRPRFDFNDLSRRWCIRELARPISFPTLTTLRDV